MGAGPSKKDASGPARFHNIDPNTTRLDLQGKNISELPNDIGLLKQLKWLSLQNNNLTTLPDSFGELISLQTLRLRGNKVSQLPATMSMLINLQNLDLSKNSLTAIPSSICMSQLLELNLQYNSIDNIPSDITRMVKLKSLNLYFNKLQGLGDIDWSSLTSLETLELAQNRISELGYELTSLKYLTHLNLAGCDLKTLPKEIGEMRSLKSLDVRFNKLAFLPEEIGRLGSTLRILHLRGNVITQLPESMGQLSNLEELQLAHNELSSLPPSMGMMACLHSLYLYQNKITSLPSELGDLTNLRELDISYNKLQSLPSNVNWYNLQALLAASNQITALDEGMFVHLTTLRHMALSYNKLVTVPQTITQLTNLNRLELNYNRLEDLPDMSSITRLSWLELCCNRLHKVPDTVPTITNLCILNLAGNYIVEIPASLATLTQLQKLNLSYNRLRSLPPEVESWKGLIELHLDGNRFESIPLVVCKLYQLKDLSICNCTVSSIPPEISKLTSLQLLRASVNRIVSIPSEFCDLTSLSELDLSHNMLRSLPDAFANLTRLTDIDLSGNAIEVIPEQFGIAAKELQQFKLSYNRLRCLPAFPEAKRKPWFSFSGNEVLSILYEKEIDEEKFLAKLDKLERKRAKKSSKLKAGSESDDGMSDTEVKKKLSDRRPNTLPPTTEEEDSSEERNQAFSDTLSDDPNIPGARAINQPLRVSGNTVPSPPDTISTSPSSTSESTPPRKDSNTKRTPKQSRRKLEKSGDDVKRPDELLDLTASTELPPPLIIGNTEVAESVSAPPELPPPPPPIDIPEPKPRSKKRVKKSLSTAHVDESFGRRKTIASVDEHKEHPPRHAKFGASSMPDTTIAIEAPRDDDAPWNETVWAPRKDLKQQEAELKDLEKALKQKLHAIKSKPNYTEEEAKKVEQQLLELKLQEKEVKYQQKLQKKNTQVLELTLSQTTTELVSADATQARDGIRKRKSMIITKEKIEIRPHAPEDVFARYRNKVGWAEMRGRRPDQQDTLVVIDTFMGVPDFYLLGVFDGHAGSSSAELAARRVPVAVANALRASIFGSGSADKIKPITGEMISQLTKEQSDKLLYNSFADVHEDIGAAKLTDGTAALVALIYYPRNAEMMHPQSGETSPTLSPKHDKHSIDSLSRSTPSSPRQPKKKITRSSDEHPGTVRGRLMLANAGDQRAVLCRNGKAIQITTDHKPDHPAELARIKQGGGFVAEDRRVMGVLALSRALGDVDLNPHVTFVPDVYFMDIYEESDEFLILACDGVWDVLTSEQAVAIVSAENGDPVRGAAKLRDLAFALNSTDNISVTVFQFKEPVMRTKRASSVGHSSNVVTRKEK